MANSSLALIPWGSGLSVGASPSLGVHKLPRRLVTERVRLSLKPLFLTHGVFFIVHAQQLSQCLLQALVFVSLITSDVNQPRGTLRWLLVGEIINMSECLPGVCTAQRSSGVAAAASKSVAWSVVALCQRLQNNLRFPNSSLWDGGFPSWDPGTQLGVRQRARSVAAGWLSSLAALA